VDKVGYLCAWELKNAYIANPVTSTANSSMKIDSTFSRRDSDREWIVLVLFSMSILKPKRGSFWDHDVPSAPQI
jgi:hypothetical protein